jgi:hypothetical protein
MKNRVVMLGAALLVLSGGAQAHTHLEKSTPAENSVVATAPSQLALHFSEATRLTAVSVQKDGDKESTHISALPAQPSKDINVPLEPLDPGKYIVSWRAVGDDNHVMSGKLHFTVSGK